MRAGDLSRKAVPQVYCRNGHDESPEKRVCLDKDLTVSSA